MQTGFFVILESVPKLVPDTDGESDPVKTLDAGVDLQTEPLQLAGFQITKNKTTYFHMDCYLEKLSNSPYPVHQQLCLKRLTPFILFCFYFLKSALFCYL